MWDPDRKGYSWAAAGYSGAINTGGTTCGLLIGSSIAIGLRHGKGLNCIPLEEKSLREKAIAEVTELYQDFTDNFKSSDCQTLIQCDFSKPGEHERYLKEEIYQGTCLRFFNHLMERFVEADKKAESHSGNLKVQKN